jgi:ribonucleotide reductase alpha subunit
MMLNKTAEVVLKKRYLLKNEKGEPIETPEEMLWRVARAIAEAEEIYGNDSEEWANKFFEIMDQQLFMPNSPTLMNAGTELNQLSACFVIPVEDSIDGIFKALWDMARVQKSGGGTGFSFSRLRPKGDLVKSTMGVASGPISFMKIFDAATEQIKQGGKRRGANMGVLNVHHPDIEEFITAKWEEGVLRNFNISVAVTDAFMEALRNDSDYELINPRTGEVVKKIPARKIFNLIVEGAWRNGEPGVIFIDEVNRHNPTPHVGQIEATNPCIAKGEPVLTWAEQQGVAWKPIEDIKPGEFVITIKGAPAKVKDIIFTGIKKCVKLTLSDGRTLVCTPDHRIFTENGWTQAKDTVGKRVMVYETGNNGSGKFKWAVVDTIVELDERPVYDIAVEDDSHSFVCKGIVVHNCGEQPLLPYESCNLGSINVSAFVKDGNIDWDRLKEVVWIAVRFLDDVIDVNNYPIPEIEEMTKANRKIGLGVMGWADLLFKLGIPYDSDEAIQLAEKLMKFIQEESHKASQHLAEERGVFPNWKGSIWEERGIKIRNATTTTIAPTGTISIIAGCSSGIEPVYALAYKRTNVLDGEEFFEVNPIFENALKALNLFRNDILEKVTEEGSIQNITEIPEEIRRVFKCALDIAPEWHVRMQAAFQKYTDNAVSKTINMPNHATRKDVENALLLAYELGCKGLTVYRDGSREEQVLKTKKTEKRKEERILRKPGKYIEPRPRPKITTGRTIETRTGCGSLYVTINEDEHGIAEVFVQLGKSGGCAASQTEAIGRLLSIALRSWVNPEALIRQLKGIRCPSIGFDDGEIVTSCADGVAKILDKYLKGEYKRIMVDVSGIIPLTEFTEEGEVEERVRTKLIGGVCPECGNILEYGEGCMTCRMCGYTKCG